MGATDLWIAHQLGSTPASIAAFRQKHGLLRTGAERPSPGGEAAGASRRAEPAPADAAPPSDAPKPRRRRSAKAERTADAAASTAAAPETAAEPALEAADAADDAAAASAPDGDGERPKRRRGRRGGRGRGKGGADTPLELEGVFDHGDEGYGLWLDGAVRDAAVYRTHWRGQREVVVRVTPDEIVIRRAGAADTDD